MKKPAPTTSVSLPPSFDSSRFRKELLAWFSAHQRDLPWRRAPSAYKTVVSEFMLQQTQVRTVLPYFARWLEYFPDFDALASAPEEVVLKAWEGLGYYSRARNLHRLAKAVVARGGPPATAKEWQELPGVGPYTSAAISSISGGEAVACVDGNVVRILARLTKDETLFRDSATAAKQLSPLADAVLDRRHPGAFNQAMMELGATVCTKASPACGLCPVRTHCASCDTALAPSLPRFEPKRYEEKEVLRLWCVRGDTLLVHRNPPTSRRLANLCELPDASEVPNVETLLNDQSLLVEKHRAITRFRITEKIYKIDARSLGALSTTLEWVSLRDVPGLAFSGPHRRWIEELLAR